MDPATATIVGALLLLGIGLIWAYGGRAERAVRGNNASAPEGGNPMQAPDVAQLRNDIHTQNQQQLQAVQALQTSVNGIAVNIERQKKTNQGVQHQLNARSTERQKYNFLRNDLAQLSDSNAQSQTRLDESTTSLRRDVDRLTAANTQLQSQLNTTIQSLRQDAQRLRDAVADITNNNNKLQADVSRLTRENTRLRRDVDGHVRHCCKEAGCFGEAGPATHTAPATAHSDPVPPGDDDQDPDDGPAEESDDASLPPQAQQSTALSQPTSRSGTPDIADDGSDGAPAQESPCKARFERTRQSSALSSRSSGPATPAAAHDPEDEIMFLTRSASPFRDVPVATAPATEPAAPAESVFESLSQFEVPRGTDLPLPLPLPPVEEPQGTLPEAPSPMPQDVPSLQQLAEGLQGTDVPLPLSPVEEAHGTLPEAPIPVPHDATRHLSPIEEQRGADVPLPQSPAEDPASEPQSVAPQTPAAQVVQQIEEPQTFNDALSPSFSAGSGSTAPSLPTPSGPLHRRRTHGQRRQTARLARERRGSRGIFTADEGHLDDAPAQPQQAVPAVEDAITSDEVSMENAPAVNEIEMEDAPAVDDEVLEDAPADVQRQGDASATLASDIAAGRVTPEPIDTDMTDAPAVDSTDSEQDAEGDPDVCPYCKAPFLLDPLFCTQDPCPKKCVRMFCTQFCFDDAHADHNAAGSPQQDVQQPVRLTSNVADVDMEDQVAMRAAMNAAMDNDLLADADYSDVESVTREPVGQAEQDGQEGQDETDSRYALSDSGTRSEERDDEQDDEQAPGPHNYYGDLFRPDVRSPSLVQSEYGRGDYNGTYLADDISRHGSRAPSFAPSDDGDGDDNVTATADYQANQTNAAFEEFLERDPPSPPRSPPQAAKRKPDSKPVSPERPSTAPVVRGPQKAGVNYSTSSKTGRAIVIPRRKNRGNVDLSAIQGSGLVVAGPSSIAGPSASPYYLPAIPSTNPSGFPTNPAISTDYPEDQLPPPRSMPDSRAHRVQRAAEQQAQREQEQLDLLEMQRLVDGESDDAEPETDDDPAGPSSAPNTTRDDQIDPALLDAFGMSGTSGWSTNGGGSSQRPDLSGGDGPDTPVRFDGLDGEYLPAKGKDEDR